MAHPNSSSVCVTNSSHLNPPAALPDRHWTAVVAHLHSRGLNGDLMLAPGEFIHHFRGAIALLVRRRMIPEAAIRYFVLHKGMLDRVDPLVLREAVSCTPTFANEVFAVFARDGQRLPADDETHLEPLQRFVEGMATSVPPHNAGIGVAVNTCNRPAALARTLRRLRQLRSRVLVVDDGSPWLARRRNKQIAALNRASYLRLPRNLGVAAARNVALAWWLAHPDVEWISMFDDDMEPAIDAFDVLRRVVIEFPAGSTLFTGYRSPLHAEHGQVRAGNRTVFLARSCGGAHLHAHRDYWRAVMPIPTAYKGAPSRSGGVFKGQGSDSDWWVSCWCPSSCIKRGGDVVVVPDLVTTFGAGRSTWGSVGI